MTYLTDEQKRELREWATSDACCRPSRFLSIASDVLALLDEIEAQGRVFDAADEATNYHPEVIPKAIWAELEDAVIRLKEKYNK